MSDWQPAEQVAKNTEGKYQALIGGKWQFVDKVAKNAEGKYMALSSAAPAIPASVSQQEEGLVSGGPFEAMSEFGSESGKRTTDVLTAGGASPALAASAGTLANVTAQAIPMITTGLTSEVSSLAGKGMKAGNELMQKGLDAGRSVISTLRGKPAEQAAKLLKGDMSGELSVAQKNLAQQALKETSSLENIAKANTSALHKLQTKKAAGASEETALQEKLLADRNAHKEVWEKDVMLKEISGNKIQDTPPFKNVLSLIDSKISKYAGNKDAERVLQKMKDAVESPNFAGLDVERQAMGSRAYRDSLSPELQNTAKEIHGALTDAMKKYSPRYGKMLEDWGEGKAKAELLEETNKKIERQVSEQTKRAATTSSDAAKAGLKAAKSASKYDAEITKLDSITDSTKVAPQALSIAKKMLSDGTIDAAKYKELNDKIESVEKLYGNTEHYRKAMKWALGTVGAAGVYEVVHHL